MNNEIITALPKYHYCPRCDNTQRHKVPRGATALIYRCDSCGMLRPDEFGSTEGWQSFCKNFIKEQPTLRAKILNKAELIEREEKRSRELAGW